MNFLNQFSKNNLLKITILMSVICFFGINIISSNILKSFRFDMTSNHLFSLTEGTKNLISNLKEPIHIRLFMSSSIVELAPQLSNYANRVESILKENTLPGYSEHHTGCAVDFISKDSYSLSVNFEKTDEFKWLMNNANKYGFYLSYPKSNNNGIMYEPWHWTFK